KDLDTGGTGAWRQITNTGATRSCPGGGSQGVFNFAPDIGGTGSSAGRYTLYISNANLTGANSPCDSWQVFAYDAVSNTSSQLTAAAAPLRYIGLPLQSVGDHYAFERLDLTPGLSQIGRRQRGTPATDLVVFQGILGATGVTMGLDGTLPVIHFHSADDPLG